MREWGTSERRLAPQEILWHRPRGKKVEELQVATTLAFLERGKLGVRASDVASSKPLFHLVPKMVVGDTAVMNLIDDGDQRRRTACVYSLQAGTVVREYPPTRVRADVLAGDYHLPLALLRTLLAHAVVNFLRLRYGNEDNQLVMYSARAGCNLARQQAERVTRPHLEGCSWEQFATLFVLLYQHREYSREIYTKLGQYSSDEGIQQATDFFEYLFARRGEEAFPQRLGQLIDIQKRSREGR